MVILHISLSPIKWIYNLLKVFAFFRCYNPKESKQFFSVSCNAEWLEKRDCHQYTSCTDCVASWPFYTGARQVD